MEENKSGKLSNDDLDFIDKHLHWTVEDIAKHLKRNPNTLKKYVKNALHKAVRNDTDEDVNILIRLIGRADWSSLQRQFSKAELEIFKQLWVSMYKQFGGDVLATEEMQMIGLIRLELLTNRNLEERQKFLKMLEDLEAERPALVDTMQNAGDGEKAAAARALNEHDMLIGDVRTALTSRTGEYTKFIEKAEQSYRSLKVTRDQRFKELADSKVTFVDWLKQLFEHQEKLESEGIELALRKKACEKETARISEIHTFMDGKVDQPFLTPDTVI